MKYTFFTLLFVFGLFFPAFSQVIPITVTPVPISGVQRSPEELTSNGTRLFAIFESYDKVLHYSDDNGATWIAKSFNIGGFLTDVVVAGTEIYVLAYNESQPGEQSLVVYRSSNNGATFVSDYSVDVTPPMYANGKPEGYISDSRLITAGNAVFMVYDFRHQDTIGNWDKTLARGWYKELNTPYWDYLNSNIGLNGPISHIAYFNNKYVLIREPREKGVTPSGLARASSTPDFLSGSD